MSAACHPDGVEIGRHSNCPSDAWHDRVAPLLAAADPSAPLVMLNIGANKGYNVAEFVQRYHFRHERKLRLTSEMWHAELLRGGSKRHRVRYGCGLCNACRARAPRAKLNVPVEAHAIEMVSLNALALRRLFAFFGVPGRVRHQLVSHESGPMRADARSKSLGDETSGGGLVFGKNISRLEWVNATSLDD